MPGQALISTGTAWVPYIGGGASIPLTPTPPPTDITMIHPVASEDVVGDYTLEVDVASTLGATAVSFQIGHIDFGLYPATRVGATTRWRSNVAWKSALSLADKVTARPADNAYWIRPHVTVPTGVVKGEYVQCFTNNYSFPGSVPVWRSGLSFTSDCSTSTTNIAAFYASFAATYGTLNNPDGNPPGSLITAATASGRMVHVVMPDDHVTTDQPNAGLRWQMQTPATMVDGDMCWVGYPFRIPTDFPTPTSSHISISQCMGTAATTAYTLGLRVMFHARTLAGTVGTSDMLTNWFHTDQCDRGHGEPGLAFDMPFYRGQIVDVVWGLGISADPRKGWFEVRYRLPGDTALTRHEFFGIPGYYRIPCALIEPNGQGQRWDQHLYRGRGKFATVSMDFGQLKIRETPELADPHSY